MTDEDAFATVRRWTPVIESLVRRYRPRLRDSQAVADLRRELELAVFRLAKDDRFDPEAYQGTTTGYVWWSRTLGRKAFRLAQLECRAGMVNVGDGGAGRARPSLTRVRVHQVDGDPADPAEPSDAAVAADRAAAVRSAVRWLPPRQRAAVAAYFGIGQDAEPLARVAARLGIHGSTLRLHLKQGLESLERRLEAHR